MVINQLPFASDGWPQGVVHLDCFEFTDQTVNDIEYKRITRIIYKEKYKNEKYFTIPGYVDGKPVLLPSNVYSGPYGSTSYSLFNTLRPNSGNVLIMNGCRLICVYTGSTRYKIHLNNGVNYYVENANFFDPVELGWGYPFLGIENLELSNQVHIKGDSPVYYNDWYTNNQAGYDKYVRYNDNSTITDENFNLYDLSKTSLPALYLKKCNVFSNKALQAIKNAQFIGDGCLNDTTIYLLGNAIKMDVNQLTEYSAVAGLGIVSNNESGTCYLDFTNLTSIAGTYNANFGRSGYALKGVIFRANQVVSCSLSSKSFQYMGTLYVPDDLVASYQADSFWGTATIKGISEITDELIYDN